MNTLILCYMGEIRVDVIECQPSQLILNHHQWSLVWVFGHNQQNQSCLTSNSRVLALVIPLAFVPDSWHENKRV